MNIATGDAAKLLFGALLFLAGLMRMWSSLRDGNIPYILNSIDRAERPIMFWGVIAACTGAMVGGASLIIGAVTHTPFDCGKGAVGAVLSKTELPCSQRGPHASTSSA